MSSDNTLEPPFELRLDSINAWLASIPVDNLRESCRLLYTGLQALNSRPLEIGFHFQALESFRSPILLKSDRLAKLFLRKRLPLDENTRRLARLDAQFHAELARGYVALARHSAFADSFGARQRALVIHRGLLSHDLLALQLARMFEALPSSFWGSVYGLYRQAEMFELLASTASDPAAGSNGSPSIDGLFQRIVAFQMSMPNRMRQEQLEKLHQLLCSHDRCGRIGREPQEAGVTARFRIDLNADGAPRLHDGDGAGTADSRYLFCPALPAGAEAGEMGAASHSALEEPLPSYVQVRFGEMPAVIPGEQKYRNALLISGWDKLLASLGAIRDKQAQTLPWSDVSGMELAPLDENWTASAPAASKTAGKFLDKKELQGSGAEFGEDGREYKSGDFHCKVFLVKTPGFYLIELIGPPLPVGKLIGLNTDNMLVQLGLVRGCRRDGIRSVLIFELLASEVRTVRMFAPGLPETGEKALLGAPAYGVEGLSALFTPPLKLRCGHSVSVEENGSSRSYAIARRLGSADEFCQFELIDAGRTTPA